MGVPYIPIVGLVGTHLLERRDDMLLLPNPFEPAVKTVVAKALRPDIAIFHVRAADRHGNVSCGYTSENVILAQASKTVIVTAEEIVDSLTEKQAVGTWMAGIDVDVVVHAPRGAHPAGMPGLYDIDRGHMAEYVTASKSESTFAAYLQKYVHDVANHEEYVERYVRDARPGMPHQAAD
jgi:glutaconate CoA-transferase subunit A